MPHDRGHIIGEAFTPKQIVEMALHSQCRSISYTYTEPTVFYELAYDVMMEARDKGLLNVFVTNGYMSRDMLDHCRGLLDAANVDLKAFNDRFYLHYCKAQRSGVMDTLRYMKELGIWVEVTTLLIPTLNDDPNELRTMVRFIRDDLGPETPWHVSRFYPQYRETSLPPTAVSELRRARQIGIEEGLRYVYTGNVPGEEGEKTFCPGCSKVVIDRVGYRIRTNVLSDGVCSYCGHHLEGVEM